MKRTGITTTNVQVVTTWWVDDHTGKAIVLCNANSRDFSAPVFAAP
jgi:hypothetical protein